MTGYKLLDNNMYAKFNNMQYKLNKEYVMDRNIALCGYGYHFCDNIEDTLLWYITFKDNRLFEIDTLDGSVIKGYRKNVSDKIKLIREISIEEIKEYIENNIERLIKDEEFLVREEVVRFITVNY